MSGSSGSFGGGHGQDTFNPQSAPPLPSSAPAPWQQPSEVPKKKPSRRKTGASSPKRRCVSTACIACRKRKSKCDGAIPSCAACASVYGTECIYDPNSDHRRKGVYKDKMDSMKAPNSTLQILVEAILNGSEDEAFTIVKKMRSCDSLDMVAEQIMSNSLIGDDLVSDQSGDSDMGQYVGVQGERELARKMGELRLENGSVRFFGGTSHLIYTDAPTDSLNDEPDAEELMSGKDPITTWTRVTDDPKLITHLVDKYFNYHYPYFTTLSRSMFERDYRRGKASLARGGTVYCSSLLVNAMLALGCHFTDIPEAYAVPGDSRTKGDHFFNEAKRLIVENSEYEKPRLVTVQALALMSVREAGCAREARGWVYSGMSFRMAQDIGLNLEAESLEKDRMAEHEIDARRITFWGCFLFDKCWSNYLGRLPLIPQNSFNVAKCEVFPDEDSEMWRPFPDGGFEDSLAQPARTRAVALQLSKLCEISGDLLIFFYHPNHLGRSSGKAVELRKLSELHRRLEDWRKELPRELEPKEGQLPNVILMHMFFHLQYIHLFRPFLKYAPSASPLPSHVSPRRICTANAGAISKLMRLYKKFYNLRQICNIAVYMVHSACTIHLLNLPEKTARRDITHGLKHLEEIAEDWLCARRTLVILSVLARKWDCQLPEEATFVLRRADEKYGYYSPSEVPSPRSHVASSPASSDREPPAAHRGAAAPIQSPQVYSSSNMDHQRPAPQFFGVAFSDSPVGGMPSIGPTVHHAMGRRDFAAVPHPAMPPSSTGVEFGRPEALDYWNDPPLRVQTARQQPYRQQRQQQQQQDYRGVTPAPNGFSNPAQEPSTGAPSSTSSHMAPQTASMAGVNIGGSEYFLSDSARWQQSFEMWRQGGGGGGGNPPEAGAAGGAPLATFVPGQGIAAAGADADGGSSSLRSTPPQHQLWGDGGDGTGLDSLHLSLGNESYLPGLD
ncbi:Fungal trans [Geosmithia morbida]|uniref:Fungal trans n=1 Tax=Geosmithia morbida TaxID=1094350 RepID=A0A9P4YY63_9HYPO|nr:Fungal trans [Geosmithia morbida]KAF4125258.1 Fungal trans [Geosmithia morbida]